ncbi:MAG: bifunctional pyr operon transcriptional regulator/uracil phosphoribosyltransferase PyrR [Bacteroidota bacterium]|jgi:pyrimidine operon attenuation protein/uracil phosphoribosyltransferase
MKMKQQLLLGEKKFSVILYRLALEILENLKDPENTVLVGLQPRGVQLMKRVMHELKLLAPDIQLKSGILDITFFRDDFRKEDGHLIPQSTDLHVSLENKTVILIDDVLYTGRSIRAAMDALLSFGRPSGVQLMVLIDRLYSRELPIHPDYTGLKVDTIVSQKVKVLWAENEGKDEVWLIENTNA